MHTSKQFVASVISPYCMSRNSGVQYMPRSMSDQLREGNNYIEQTRCVDTARGV